ncbi:class I SAM-dependent methyltransferase [Streptomyces sp. NPDC005840]|uniref:Class I SAM-dependent methyltransferase n=1 Tax=Streptomyces doudnae TaxID=3075536 RepID=A0ABD5ETD8_9ACTN|nr:MULTISPECIES: class I SAM-dependent methyltransferase [unclassified Streptomyces]MDT0436672.1 class I SAM-dependent methyltransferase [Streptomyces sp. DSM 41981]MYQ68433.1 methyltransferase domain-containing protein [Streptomyces sp. SID4950]SCE46168.1 Methyltransferase domain-containing protein [Streptomyces sp. SolWspMP-5a-2]
MTDATESAVFWEKHYGGLDPRLGTRPNAVLTALLADLAPATGTALDLGCGHGGDALWLAGQGWEVTAVDVSRTALDRVAGAAAAAGVGDRVRPRRHDLGETFPEGTFDLVTATYFHTPVALAREDVLRRALRAVAPGGLLVVIEHASTAPWSWLAGQDIRYPTPDEVVASLRLDGSWQVERSEAPRRTATGPDGQTATVTDNVIAVRRVA